ncbi:MAG: hypothetical protein NTZ78_14945 [Candidatus Aureabacteria bacterium]|nr:hypothetical protein [Candidatus Auribacterota bacterium]
MMRYLYMIFCAALFAAGASAEGIELNKRTIHASLPDPQGNIAIQGAPGSVVGLPPIYIMARNKRAGTAVNASAFPDGSFGLQIPANGGDTVKLTFISANGKKKDLTVKVVARFKERKGRDHKHKGSDVNVDLGQFSQFGAPEVVQVKPNAEGGTTVHVGDRPTAIPSVLSPELQEVPPATAEIGIPPSTPDAQQTSTEDTQGDQ